MTEIGRRGFLEFLGAAGAGFVVDPERLLWVPGRKTIFVLPPLTSWPALTGSSLVCAIMDFQRQTNLLFRQAFDRMVFDALGDAGGRPAGEGPKGIGVQE